MVRNGLREEVWEEEEREVEEETEYLLFCGCNLHLPSLTTWPRSTVDRQLP